MGRLGSRAVSRVASGATSDRGVSLVELLVTMMLLGILGGVVGTTFVGATGSLQRSTARQQNTALAQTGMENLTKTIRGGSLIQRSGDVLAAAALSEATPTTLEIHSFLGARPTKVRYAIDAQGRLTETRTPADSTSVPPFWTFTGAATTRVVITRVVNTAAQPLFVYLDGTGVPIVGAPLVGDPLDEAQRRGVRSVAVTLVVQGDDGSTVRPAEVQQRVQLPNLGAVG